MLINIWKEGIAGVVVVVGHHTLRVDLADPCGVIQGARREMMHPLEDPSDGAKSGKTTERRKVSEESVQSYIALMIRSHCPSPRLMQITMKICIGLLSLFSVDTSTQFDTSHFPSVSANVNKPLVIEYFPYLFSTLDLVS